MVFPRISPVLIASALLIAVTTAANAQIPPYHDADSDSFEIGLEGQWYQYREPSFVKLQGYGYGLVGTYTHNFDPWFVKADIIADFYNLHYSSNGNGSESGVTDYKQDYRALFGRSFKVSHSTSLQPFSGIGYRLLFDENGANITSTGSQGYDRQSEYLYLPIGLSADIRLGKWQLRPTAEYDYLIQGYQTSYLSSAGFDNNLNNTQDVGYGLRASFMVQPPVNFFNFSFGPYVRYWSIHDSNVQTLFVGGVPAATGYEPGNTTLEYGLDATLKF